MYEVDELTRTKKGVTLIDGLREPADGLVHPLLQGLALGNKLVLKTFHLLHIHKPVILLSREGCAWGEFGAGGNVLTNHPPLLVKCEHDVSLNNTLAHAGRPHHHHLSALAILHVMCGKHMVVAIANEVEARHLFGHQFDGILSIFGCDDATVETTVEQSHDKVGLLTLLDYLHPLASRAHHLLKPESRPQLLRQPIGNGRSEQTKDGYLHARTIQDEVWLKVGFARLHINDVCTEYGELTLSNPTVIDLMTRFHIMITDGTTVILHHVHGLSHEVGRLGVDEVIVVGCGLSLQTISAICQDESVAMFLALFLHIGIDGRQPAADIMFLEIVVLKERCMDITGMNPFQVHFAIGRSKQI